MQQSRNYKRDSQSECKQALAGLARYERRLDKGYSLQDCVSMNVMEAEGITGVLTSDHHFEQEGFTILMRLDQ